MRKVSINEAIVEAINNTDENLGRYPNQVLNWAKYIEKEIGTLKHLPAYAKKYNVTGVEITIPKDAFDIIGVMIGDYEDELNLRFRDLQTRLAKTDVRPGASADDEDLTFLWMPQERTMLNKSRWVLIGDKLNFIDEYDSQDITVVYTKIETDENGFWLVNESHIDAITKFIIYKYAKKFQWRIFKSDKLLRQGHFNMLNSLERDYSHAIRNARAIDDEYSNIE